ncbi:hypothetical protein PG994_009317 [Apiospora phragmitis]|uniref:Uncharacterized protein n=1 Tax=Apiospora phragmitis TaxID=2905665 RepID=A0ABR1UIZ5_9PEZI
MSILSHSAVGAFLEAEAAIATQVLLNQVDAIVPSEAIAASVLTRSGLEEDEESSGERTVISFMDENLRHRPAVPRSRSLLEVLRAARLHLAVQEYGISFANEIVAEFQLNPSKPTNVIRQEICQRENDNSF